MTDQSLKADFNFAPDDRKPLTGSQVGCSEDSRKVFAERGFLNSMLQVSRFRNFISLLEE